jgi:hypothetical protein
VAMLAEIFMLSVEADVRSLKALKPMGNVPRFVPIELPVSSAANDLPRPATAGLGPTLADDPASHG